MGFRKTNVNEIENPTNLLTKRILTKCYFTKKTKPT